MRDLQELEIVQFADLIPHVKYRRKPGRNLRNKSNKRIQLINVAKNGKTATHIRSTDTWARRDDTKKLTPRGGVKSAISLVTTILIPK